MVLFEEQRARWMQRADELKPELKHKIRRPIAIVNGVEDPHAFQGWRVEASVKAGDLAERKLQLGDSIALDFGNHLVGHLHLALVVHGASMGGPLRLRIKAAEIPCELCTDFDEYSGSLSRGWLQDEIVTLDFIPPIIKIPRRLAFQYIKIEVLAISFDYKISIEDIYCETTTSADDALRQPRPNVAPEFARIESIGWRTLASTMQTVLEDGAKRDRRLWLGDTALQADAIYVSYTDTSLILRCLYLFAALSHEDGRLAACLYQLPEPHHGPELILDFAILFGDLLLEYGRNSRDWDSVRDLWPVAIRQLDFLTQNLGRDFKFQDNGEWWIFVDWNADLDRTAAMQGLALRAVNRLIELAKELNIRENTVELTQLQQNILGAAHRSFKRSSSGLILSGANDQISLASQIWFVLGDVFTGNDAAMILTEALQSSDALKSSTPFMHHYLVEALLKVGLFREAVDVVKGYWGRMVDYGASTFWEIFDEQNHYASPYDSHLVNSYSHSWSCGPVYFIRKYPHLFSEEQIMAR